jgi:hypothetical protein
MLKVSGSISTNTGFNPSVRAISGTTQNVSAGKNDFRSSRQLQRLENIVECHPTVGRRIE